MSCPLKFGAGCSACYWRMEMNGVGKCAVVAIAEALGMLCNNVANGNRQLAAKVDKEAKLLGEISRGMQKLEKMAKRSGR